MFLVILIFCFRSKLLKQTVSLESQNGHFPDLTEELEFFDVSEVDTLYLCMLQNQESSSLCILFWSARFRMDLITRKRRRNL